MELLMEQIMLTALKKTHPLWTVPNDIRGLKKQWLVIHDVDNLYMSYARHRGSSGSPF